VIDENPELDLPLVDLTRETLTSGLADKLIREEINRPFNLSSDRLVRARLLRIASDEHLLIVTMHHIVSDDWSLKIFFRELGDLYDAFAAGRPADLADLPIGYPDFAAWQHQSFQSAALKEQLDFWKDRLQDQTGPFELPTDHPRGPSPTFRGAV